MSIEVDTSQINTDSHRFETVQVHRMPKDISPIIRKEYLGAAHEGVCGSGYTRSTVNGFCFLVVE